MIFQQDFLGLTLQDKYLFTKKIGGGNQGQVYLASVLKDQIIINGEEQKQVAIKVVAQNSLKGKEKELLQNEIKALREIESDYVVRCFEVIEDKENTYIVQEYCPEGSLEEFFKKNKQNRVIERFIKDFYRQILFGLQELHQKRILHRDIKLSNILVKSTKEFKIGDLGFCKKLEENQDICHTVLGTRMYMAPELLKMEKYGIEAELFSVGVLFYLLCQGEFPFQAKSPPGLLKAIEAQQIKFKDISTNLENLLRKMLQCNPKERIQFKDIFNEPFFKDEDGDGLFMNSSHVDDREIIEKQNKYIEAYNKIEKENHSFKEDFIQKKEEEEEEQQQQDRFIVQKYPKLEEPNRQFVRNSDQNNFNMQLDIQPIGFEPPKMNFPKQQNQPNNQFINFQNYNLFQPMHPYASDQDQQKQQNQPNQFMNLNQQPNFVPFQKQQIAANPFQISGFNNPQQIIQSQNQQQYQNQNFLPQQPKLNLQVPYSQNDILKNSSQQQFQKGSEIYEQTQINKQMCDNLVKKADSIQQSYTYLFLAMRNLAYLSGKCEEFKIPFQTYIGAPLFILKQKCQNMNQSLLNQIQSQEYNILKQNQPQQYNRIIKIIESNKQEIDVFDFLADEQYQSVKNCIYPIFQKFIQDYVKNISRMFDVSYNSDLRTVLIDVLLDVMSPKKITYRHRFLVQRNQDDLNKLIRDCCIYLLLSIYVDDQTVNIQDFEQQLKSKDNDYKNLICNSLEKLIGQVDESLLIKDIALQEEAAVKRFELYLAEKQKSGDDDFGDFDDFSNSEDSQFEFPIKDQFFKRLNRAKKQIQEEEQKEMEQIN